MRNTSVQKFYTDDINKYFGITCNSVISEFDGVINNQSISLKWKTIHQDYLSANEALVLGIKVSSDDKAKSHSAHDLFDHALSSCTNKGSGQQLINLAMGIYYFKKAVSEKDIDKQQRILKVSEHYVRESISLNEDCTISRLQLVLVKVALEQFNSAVKELVRYAKKSEESKIYELLFKIYEAMELPNVALYYSLKASKGKRTTIH